ASTGVRDAEHDEVSGNQSRVGARIAYIQRDVVRQDGECAAVGHGVAGVDDQIHQHLPNVTGVGFDTASLLAEHHGHGDIFINETMQHFVEIFHDRIELENDGVNILLAAEDEQLAGQADGAL